MATRTPQPIQIAGTTATYFAASAGGDKVPPGNSFLLVKNASAGSINCTVVTPGTVAGQAIGDVVVAVPATTGERLIGPFPNQHFASPTDGQVDITWSATASVTFAVLAI